MTRNQKGAYALCLALSIPAFVWMFPILWIFSLSFQPNELLRVTTSNTFLGFIPYPFTTENYAALFTYGHTHRWFFNSVVVSLGMTFGVLFLSSTAGYAFARLKFPFKTPLFVFCMTGMMIPEQAVFIPLYTMFSDFGWHNTYTALIIPRLSVPIGVFIMCQFFKEIGKEVEEAAYLDGANRFKVFLHIMLPMAQPAMITLSILTFLYAWNDYLWPLVSTQKTDMFTITVGLAGLQSNFAQSEGLGRIMASGVIASLPVILLFLFFQKYVVKAVTFGGSKG